VLPLRFHLPGSPPFSILLPFIMVKLVVPD
jgi:hypothetical protein